MAPLCIFIVAALAERREKEESRKRVWIGVEELFWDRNKTLIWKNCVDTVKGMAKKMEIKKELPNRRKEQNKNKKPSRGAQVISEICNSNIW